MGSDCPWPLPVALPASWLAVVGTAIFLHMLPQAHRAKQLWIKPCETINQFFFCVLLCQNTVQEQSRVRGILSAGEKTLRNPEKSLGTCSFKDMNLFWELVFLFSSSSQVWQTGERFLQVIYYNWLLLFMCLYENMVLLRVACPCDHTLLLGVFSTFGVRTV